MSKTHLVNLTEEERNVILGTLLGDGSISLSGPNQTSARIRIQQSLSQKRLVKWKYERLKRLVGTRPRVVSNGGYGKLLCAFSTLSFPELKDIYEMTHVGTKKAITTQWLESISHPIALAVWYMDDGSQGRSAMFIHTEGYSQKENKMLSAWLTDRWNIENKIISVGKYWRLQFPATGRDFFQDLIREYVIPEMSYKILPKMENVYCTMCGKRFQLERGQILKNRLVVLCGSKDCSTRWVRMSSKIRAYYHRAAI